MKKIFDECVGCPKEIGCLGDTCPNQNVARFYCDECGEEEILYIHDGEELCQECLLKKFEKVDGSDWW